jgi:dihydrofolate reductase
MNIVVAVCKNNGIGFKNRLPWTLKNEIKYFKNLTIGKGNNAVIMGKNTWNSIRVLEKRDILILSSTLKVDYTLNMYNIVKSFSNIDDLLKFIKTKNYEDCWVIGGSTIYKQFLELNLIKYFYITLINEEYKCDTYLQSIPKNYFQVVSKLRKETTENGNNTYCIIFRRAEKGMGVEYNNDKEWIIENIHFDDYPHIYFTIKKGEIEKQTVKERLKLTRY